MAKYPDKVQKWYKIISDDLRDGGKIFGSTIVKTMNLNEYKEAIDEFKKIATQGKILINCS